MHDLLLPPFEFSNKLHNRRCVSGLLYLRARVLYVWVVLSPVWGRHVQPDTRDRILHSMRWGAVQHHNGSEFQPLLELCGWEEEHHHCRPQQHVFEDLECCTNFL